jgi:hypothetical protein
MTTSTRIARSGWVVAIAALVLGLSGCGSSSSEPGATAHSNLKKGAPPRVNDPSTRPPDDMVAAVSVGKGGPPVGLKFELRSTPQAGQPLDIDLAVIPNAPAIDRIDGRFHGGKDLDIVDGTDLAAVEKPATGTVIRHVVRLVPKEDGIFTLTATVTVDLETDSITRTFTIPVIVGEGLPELTAKSGATEGEATAGTGSKPH